MQHFVPALLATSLFCATAPAQLGYPPQWRDLGPANMSGRIVDIDVDPTNPARWFAASASGGLFRTVNAGTTWQAVFDKAETISLGAVAIAPSDPQVVWIGTGEGNARNSVSWGNGVYVSRDGGDTWKNSGLEQSFQIGRIAVHPKDPETVFVAACGRLWGENPERGLYRTIDGGKQWQQVLKVDDKTGAIDVLIDPANPDLVFAATYERKRDQFDGNDPVKRWGPGSGIWRSENGGITFRRVTDGLPTCAMGRIGLALAPSDPKILYAVVETERSGWATGTEKAPKNAKGKPHKGYSTRLGGQVPNVHDKQGADGFETGGVFRSEDHGVTWKRVNSLTPRPFYFSQIRVDPENANGLCVLGVQYYVSADAGAKFEMIRNHGIHVDFHDLWIDPNNPQHWLMCGDGGIAESWNRGAQYRFFDNLPCAQFYRVSVDNRDPYHVYGGLQDNGSWGFPTRSRYQDGLVTGDVYKFGMGDGFRVVPHPKTEGLVYYTSQNGGVGWRNVLTGEGGRVAKPKAAGNEPLRYNWDTPFTIAPTTPYTLWIAGSHVIRIDKDPKKSEVVSPRLGRTDRGTATALSISTKSKKTMYVGTDDGAVWVSRNGGKKWKNLTTSIIRGKGMYVSSLQASHHSAETVYMSIDGHRSNDHGVYAFVSRSAGRTWRSIGSGIPRGPVRVLAEDPVNPDLLYAGTEFGFYLSMDRGKTWLDCKGNLPTVAVHDLAIQTREKELVIATHGRGLWRLDVAGLQGCSARTQRKALDLVTPQPVTRRRLLPTRRGVGHAAYRVPNAPGGAVFYYWIRSRQVDPPRLEVLDAKDKVVHRLKVTNEPGLHRVTWDLKYGKKRRKNTLRAGTYEVRLQSGKTTVTKKLRVVSGS